MRVCEISKIIRCLLDHFYPEMRRRVKGSNRSWSTLRRFISGEAFCSANRRCERSSTNSAFNANKTLAREHNDFAARFPSEFLTREFAQLQLHFRDPNRRFFNNNAKGKRKREICDSYASRNLCFTAVSSVKLHSKRKLRNIYIYIHIFYAYVLRACPISLNRFSKSQISKGVWEFHLKTSWIYEATEVTHNVSFGCTVTASEWKLRANRILN